MKEELCKPLELPAAGSAGEEVEVVAYRYRCTDVDGNPIPNWYYSDDAGSLGLREPLMTVAQHERIVAALSAQQSAQPEFCCKHSYKVANQYANQQALECNKLSTDLEAARGLLRESRKSYTEAIHWEDQQPVMKKIDAFLTAFPVPEVRCQTCDGTGDVHRSDGEWLGVR